MLDSLNLVKYMVYHEQKMIVESGTKVDFLGGLGVGHDRASALVRLGIASAPARPLGLKGEL